MTYNQLLRLNELLNTFFYEVTMYPDDESVILHAIALTELAILHAVRDEPTGQPHTQPNQEQQ